MKLVYGVVEIPYVSREPPEEEKNSKGKPKKKQMKLRASTITTGDVAEFLEERYGVFAAFHKLHEKDVFKALEERVLGALENALMGHDTPPEDMFVDLSPIEELFRRAIDDRRFDGLIKGVPTKASLDGVNHRLKRPYAVGNPVRPSFLDTGLYRASAKVYIEK